MIFFHGTVEEHIKNIKKTGVKAATTDPWILEITKENVCCLSKEPASGEGGNAAYFAGRTKNQKQNGYLVAMRIHRSEIMQQKLIAIVDNKQLDDYVRYHFFPRQEFREVGFSLYTTLDEYRKRDHSFRRVDTFIQEKSVNDFAQKFSFAVKEKRQYYCDILPEQHKCYQLEEVSISDELHGLILAIGWKTFFDFLQLHFAHFTQQKWDEFTQNAPYQDDAFWKMFYERYPLQISDDRYSYFANWFSPQWLQDRFLQDIEENCQIWVKSMEPQYILTTIHITTPSGVVSKFKSCKTRQGFSRMVWKEVNKVLEKN
ncbi:hypothetical protein [Candidatus Uabimicrobium amorphum]|uniref:Uncharacterized protein n=1 Tax=Uabimicrobium amorphum TaxID=2596890 RepID=A0A5S9IPH1_UABAM|nr:hypothetical protein [Candidatus Uabimicrobium amorphum]BBM85649.1 hypothetical protein UABAM_04023 [Candidatus Uabimicrobium amorphum]